MNFQSEYAALQKWRDEEEAKLEEAHVPRPGFDDGMMYARRPITKEYNRRLAELKRKYGVEG